MVGVKNGSDTQSDAISISEKIELEKMVLSFYNNSDVDQNQIINIVAIARQHGFTVQTLNMSSSMNGMIMCDSENATRFGAKKLIVIKKGLDEEEARFILAHELGHYLLHLNYGSGDNIYYRDFSTNKKSKDIEEVKADYCARALLMPYYSIKQCINEGMNISDTLSKLKIAKQLKVSLNNFLNRLIDVNEIIEEGI